MVRVTEKITDNKWIKLIICLVGSVIACVGLIGLYIVSGINYDTYAKRTFFTEGWTLEYRGNTYTDVDIDDVSFDTPLKDGEKVVLYNTLPDYSEYTSPVLYTKTINCVITVYVDDKEIYSYGQERFDSGRIIGSGFHTIELPEDADSQAVRVEITASGASAIKKISTLYITDYSLIYTELITRYRVDYSLSVFLIMFGFFLMIAGLIIWIARTWIFRIVWIGMFSYSVGLWTICHTNIIQTYAIPLYICSLIEYAMIYTGGIPLLLFFFKFVMECEKKIMKYLYFILLGVQIVMTTFVFTMHGNGIYMSKFLTCEQILIVLLALFLVTLMILRMKRRTVSDTITIVGFFIFDVCVIVELVDYLFGRYFSSYDGEFVGVSALGTAVFIIFMLISFIWEVTGRLIDDREQKMLYKMAYQDNLTGLYNRQFSEEKMQEFGEQNVRFGIYNFDLNGLKSTNDSKGHSYGDDLIKGFAHILEQTFNPDGYIVRNGGDEFIVLMQWKEGCDWESYIDRLMDNMKKTNEEQEKFVFSTAYGFADSDELPLDDGSIDIHGVYCLADNRMYENKKLCHDARN
jgi:diguanylate cyclase (GGDEF)-like protein